MKKWLGIFHVIISSTSLYTQVMFSYLRVCQTISTPSVSISLLLFHFCVFRIFKLSQLSSAKRLAFLPWSKRNWANAIDLLADSWWLFSVSVIFFFFFLEGAEGYLKWFSNVSPDLKPSFLQRPYHPQWDYPSIRHCHCGLGMQPRKKNVTQQKLRLSRKTSDKYQTQQTLLILYVFFFLSQNQCSLA